MSGIIKATRDVITDFEHGIDLIDFSAFDANPKTATFESLNPIGLNQSFTGTAGELRAYRTSTGDIIDADITGDGKADFSIELIDPAHAFTFNDIVLN